MNGFELRNYPDYPQDTYTSKVQTLANLDGTQSLYKESRFRLSKDNVAIAEFLRYLEGKTSLAGLKYVSFFHYFNVTGSLVNNHISNSSYLIFISVSVFSTLMGALILKYRDFII